MFSGFDPNFMTTQDMMAGHHAVEEDQFFDARDEIASVSDLGSDCSEDGCFCSGLPNCVVNSIGYDFWVKTPESAHVRRSRLLKWMGLISNQNQVEKEDSDCILCDEIKMGIDRISEDSGSVLRNLNLNDCFLPSRSSVSSCSTEEAELLGDNSSEENFLCRINNLDDGKQFVIDEVRSNGLRSRLREVGSNRVVTTEEFPRIFSSSSQRSMCGEAEADGLGEVKSKVKSGWLRKLSVIGHIVGRQGETKLKPSSFNSEGEARIPRVQVHSHRKRSKELSSLYVEQEFAAHEGSISTMKFSPDGQYLASAGEDGIVRVWKVIEDDKPNKLDSQPIDPSCLYLSVNHVSKLVSLGVNKDKIGKTKGLKKSSESACVIFPSKVFQIIEEPLNEFHGHGGEVLALSWSNNGYLLSSSVDKTVRLWQIGHNQCLRVFSHNNYVTCVEFNPVDDNYFISGSIDGKVRIWEVHACRVVDWIDIREIVTAVCYVPNGKGGIVGSIDGSCHFYSIIDNQLQLDAQICLQGKKKLPCKRITGFQFSPNDPSKVLVTCADSQIQVLCGVEVVFKFKGPRTSGSHTTASFTADGKHIVSTSENSNVHVWDYNSQDTTSRAKKIWSCESFASYNTSIAIPWCGMKTMSGSLLTPSMGDDDPAGCNFRNGQSDCDLQNSTTTSSSRDCFSLSRMRLLSQPSPKGNATWPEDKLPNSSPMTVSPTMSRSEYKILKCVCHNAECSHMWGLVIVTAGWDGRIRTYHNYGLPPRL